MQQQSTGDEDSHADYSTLDTEGTECLSEGLHHSDQMQTLQFSQLKESTKVKLHAKKKVQVVPH